MLSLAVPGRSWAHRLPAGVKLIGLAVASTALFPVGDLRILAVSLVVALALTASLGPAVLKQTFRLIRPLWFMVGLLIAFHVIFGQVAEGVATALRLVTLVLLANVVTMTTPLKVMMGLVSRLLTPLRPLGVNPRAVSVAMGMVIRFTPVLLERAELVRESWRARSIRPGRWRLVAPIGAAVLDDADRVADALRARGGVAAVH